MVPLAFVKFFFPLYKTSQLVPWHRCPQLPSLHMLTVLGNSLETGSSLAEPAIPQCEETEGENFPQSLGLLESGRPLMWAQSIRLVIQQCYLFSNPGALGLKNVLETSGRSVWKWYLNIITLTSKNNINLKLNDIGVSEKK